MPSVTFLDFCRKSLGFQREMNLHSKTLTALTAVGAFQFCRAGTFCLKFQLLLQDPTFCHAGWRGGKHFLVFSFVFYKAL